MLGSGKGWFRVECGIDGRIRELHETMVQVAIK